MKKILILTLLILFGLPSFSLAVDFQPEKNYQGVYKSKRLYRLDYAGHTWYVSDHPSTFSGLTCKEARIALETQGTWTGHLTDAGRCNGYSEAPTWATGNYLNFEAESTTNGMSATK